HAISRSRFLLKNRGATDGMAGGRELGTVGERSPHSNTFGYMLKTIKLSGRTRRCARKGRTNRAAAFGSLRFSRRTPRPYTGGGSLQFEGCAGSRTAVLFWRS